MNHFRTLFLLVVVFLTGCSQHNGKEYRKGVAAVVNGVEITEREIDYLYQRRAAPGLSTVESYMLRRTILADLVKTQLLAQKARSLKLENTPDYTIALYNAQNSVLAMMAEKKLTESVGSADKDLIKVIIDNNPRLFNQRRLFRYDELVIASVDKKLLDNIDKKVSAGSSVSQLIDFLNQNKIQNSYTHKTVTSDNIPDVLASALEKMKPDVPQVIRVIDRYSLVIVLKSNQHVPVIGVDAEKKAALLYKSQNINLVLRKELTTILNSSEIKYYGEYASKNGNQNNDSERHLPVPDHLLAKKIQNKKIALAGFLSISIVSSIMSLTSAMRFAKGALWLPRLWPEKKEKKNDDTLYEIPFELHVIHKFTLVIFAILITSGIGIEVLALVGRISFGYITFAIMAGIIVGILASRLYAIKKIQDFTDKTFIILAGLFIMPIYANLLLILRYSQI